MPYSGSGRFDKRSRHTQAARAPARIITFAHRSRTRALLASAVTDLTAFFASAAGRCTLRMKLAGGPSGIRKVAQRLAWMSAARPILHPQLICL